MSGHSGCGCGGSHGEREKRDEKKPEKAIKTGGSGAVPDAAQCEHKGNRPQDTESGQGPTAGERRGSCCP